ncbi:hypothetical protein [Nocardia flavorosea]|uniref:hypothetical protein n=1 Tax=Nocardia flavorosea TaxID=53429 RepID=UPI002458546E|nr:hypothetical protein [Nocardia flavorosea]
MTGFRSRHLSGNRRLRNDRCAVLLLAAPALAESTVIALADVLLRHSGALMPERAHGTQFFDRRWLVSTVDIPLHPAAADHYRSVHG